MFLTPSLDLVLSKVMLRRCRNSGFLECSTLDIRHSQNSGTEDCSGIQSDIGLLAELRYSEWRRIVRYSNALLPCLVTPSSPVLSNFHLSPISSLRTLSSPYPPSSFLSLLLHLILPSLSFSSWVFPPTLSLPHLPFHLPIPSLLHPPSHTLPLPPTSHTLPPSTPSHLPHPPSHLPHLPTSHTLPQGQ